MKKSIAFLWIENYSNVLVNLGLNFGCEKIFKVDLKKGNLILTSESNVNYIPDFFQNPDHIPGIVNISAIIGKNGTGKSLLCKLLREIIGGGRISTNFLMVYRIEDDKGNVKFEGVNTTNYSLQDATNILSNVTGKIEPLKFEEYEFGGGWHGDSKVETIYYSPLIDFSNVDILTNIPPGIDISSNHLSYNDIRFDERSPSEFNANDFITIPRVSNFKRQYEMLQELRTFKFPAGGIQLHFDEITVNIVRLKTDLSKIWKSENGWNVPTDFKSMLEAISQKYDLEEKKLNKIRIDLSRKKDVSKLNEIDQDLYFNDFCLNALIFFVYNINTDNTHIDHKANLDLKNLEGKSFADSVKYFFLHQKLINPESILLSIGIIEEKKKEINFASNSTNRSKIKLDKESILSLFVNNINASLEFQLKGVGGIKRVFNEFLEFDWGVNLSSGEKFYLDLFSRLYYAKKIIANSISEEGVIKKYWPELIILILDEGEIGFHPRWQKEYINNLIKIVPSIFSRIGKMKNGMAPIISPNIQIIITSHSPFSLSDIPIYNVNFFDKEEKNNKLERKFFYGKEVGMEETFAANIHEIYAESFFLEEGLMGDFAKEKLNEIIILLENGKLDLETQTTISKAISLIGEPILRERLREMFDEKYESEDSIKDKIDNLTKQLDLRKNAKNKGK